MGFWSRLWKALTTAAVTPAPAVEVVSVENLLALVKTERAKYPAPVYNGDVLTNPLGNANAWAIVNAVAYQNRNDGWGLKYKPSGNSWNERAIDVLMHKPSGRSFDVLGSSGEDGVPCWGELTGEQAVDPSLWRAPVAPATVEPAPDPIEPPIDPVDPPIVPSPVLARLEAAITAFCKSWLGV